ncbi:MAG TPA: hypothetical protein PLM56_06105 [Cyclobacteriaceae bacterium]|jgi:uncharacterized membrane protein YvbJ|nr:hypothetical protein [Cytophagales bacterium]HMR57895.1 hypothetical protein [Cyclobacteriaceae bacterium]HRE67342.1 hypothetical protein [Cyclobacteriaceae bacterium]HRF33050.1 hypothetical protein [Cyclobacteriaceae bacterium]
MAKIISLAMIMVVITGVFYSAQKNPQAHPETVAEAIFEAARSGDCKNLAALIDTDADSDAKMIAQAVSDKNTRKSFVKYFAKGKVNGKPVVSDDKALVNILFGPDGTDEETFEMVRKDGKWYLYSF